VLNLMAIPLVGRRKLFVSVHRSQSSLGVVGL